MPIIEMCHIILSSKENTLWQEVSQNLVLGWDRVESVQTLTYIFRMVASAWLKGLAPGFPSTYGYRSESSQLSTPPEVAEVK